MLAPNNKRIEHEGIFARMSETAVYQKTYPTDVGARYCGASGPQGAHGPTEAR